MFLCFPSLIDSLHFSNMSMGILTVTVGEFIRVSPNILGKDNCNRVYRLWQIIEGTAKAE